MQAAEEPRARRPFWEQMCGQCLEKCPEHTLRTHKCEPHWNKQGTVGTNPTWLISRPVPWSREPACTHAKCHHWKETSTSCLPELQHDHGSKPTLSWVHVCLCMGSGPRGIAQTASTWAPCPVSSCSFHPSSRLCSEEKVCKHSRVLLFSPKLHTKGKLASAQR